MAEQPKPLESCAGCGCLLVLGISAFACWLGGKEFGSLVFCVGIAVFLVISSFFAAVVAEDPNVRHGSGCLSFLTLVVSGFLVHHFYPEKMWMFYTFCGIYVFCILLGVGYRQSRQDRGMHAAVGFQRELEKQGVDLNNMDE